MSAQREDYAVAIHEAAHAVVGRVLGLNCGGAEIQEGGRGYTMVFAPDACATRNWIAMSMAAGLAERMLLGLDRSWPSPLSRTCVYL
jgi:hypothetical protein